MKKYIIVILSILVLLTSSVLYIYAESTCQPWHRKQIITSHAYESLGMGGHRYIKTNTTYCLEAGCNKLDISETSEFQSHYGSDWHSGTKHYYSVSCGLCKYNNTISYNCSGNPCITPQNDPAHQ